MLEFFKPSYISNIDDARVYSFSFRNTLRDELTPTIFSAPVTDILKRLFNKKDVSLAMLRVFRQNMVMSDMRTIYAKGLLVKPA